MNNTGLGGVVCSLQLWDIDNVTGHGGRGYESTLGEAFQLLTIDGGAFLLLTAPMLASSASTVECTIEICSYYFAVMFNLAIEGRDLGSMGYRSWR
jgi:hypothetical protein